MIKNICFFAFLAAYAFCYSQENEELNYDSLATIEDPFLEDEFTPYAFYQTQVGINYLNNTNLELPFGLSADQLFVYRSTQTYAIGFGIGTSIYLNGSGLPIFLNNRLYKQFEKMAFYGYADVGYDLSFSGPLFGNGIGFEFYTQKQGMFTIQLGHRYQKMRFDWYTVNGEYIASNLQMLQLKISLQY